MSIYYPPAAPALLKASVEAAGFSCKTLDFVIQFHDKYFYTHHWNNLDNWMVVIDNYDPKITKIFKDETEEWARQILSHDPTWVGLSVFSYESHKVTKLLCLALRKQNPAIKILLGGAGVSDDDNSYGDTLLNQGLCDDVIKGDGEESIIKLLQNEHKEEFDRLENLDAWPYADWSDYNLNRYKTSKEKQNQAREKGKDIWSGYGNAWYRSDEILTLPLVGSRGCVRKCSFCDIPYLWPKYKTRTAQNIADEIFYNYETYNVQRFHFTDSLMNGNTKNFNRLAEILADYRTTNKADFTITGQYIVRTEDQESQDMYYTLSDAGVKILEVGIESGSEQVRYHLGKRFSNRDIDVFIERLQKAKMSAVLLFIVGYPTETEKDFQDTLDMLTRYQVYLDDATIIEACLGGTMRVEDNSALSRDPDIIFSTGSDGKPDHLAWNYTKNPDLTLKERIKRRVRLMKHAEQLGYMSPTNQQEMLYLKSKWESLKDHLVS